MAKIEIFCVNTQRKHRVEIGTTLEKFRDSIFPNEKLNFLGALVNNELKDMDYYLINPKQIEFITIHSQDGYSTYIRSLIFILYKAVKNCFPRKQLIVEYYISNGIYCKLKNQNISQNPNCVELIKKEMQRIVAEDYDLRREELPTDEAIKILDKQGLKDRSDMLSTRGRLYTSIYYIENTADYFYGILAPTTGCISNFDLIPYKDGMLLMRPDKKDTNILQPYLNQDKLFEIFKEHKNWNKILGIYDIGRINLGIDKNLSNSIIQICEGLHEKKISDIADIIKKKRKKTRIVLIAGPSSSGKTTFGKRLSVQLLVNGIRPINLSLDNYFVNRADTPRDEKGEYDYECLEALDIQLFSQNMIDLLDGKEIDVPKYSFETGNRYYDNEKLSIKDDDIIVIEGIHGLNPGLTKLLPEGSTFKIFVSALTSISIDNHNIINPSDNRLIRRLVRDYKYRKTSALDTLRRWDSVLKGEQVNIIPYQEEADVMFNSALLYEICALKHSAEPLLREVSSYYPEHSKALKLLKFLSYIKLIPLQYIPNTSLLREFLGGSSFKY